LAALARQGRGLAVIVVDDQSSDGTREAVARSSYPSLEVRLIVGAPLPSGWAGKLWALQQGFAAVDRPYTLLLDADIDLAAGLLTALLRVQRARRATLVSIMAQLHCERFWERLLVPPFVFFFKLLYPFALVNDPQRRAAGAAGGCVLVMTDALRALDGFAAIRGALIDDCTLAAEIKKRGGGLWLGMSRSVRSLRGYGDLRGFWGMVSRSAFTQLRYSVAALLVASVLLIVVFVAPVASIAAGETPARMLGSAALLAMCLVYWPVARFYRLSPPWLLTLPLAASLFLAMTWTSAVSYWRGRRATWKNRVYETGE
jgi:hopene-associated glycosyltransferase HpnB